MIKQFILILAAFVVMTSVLLIVYPKIQTAPSRVTNNFSNTPTSTKDTPIPSALPTSSPQSLLPPPTTIRDLSFIRKILTGIKTDLSSRSLKSSNIISSTLIVKNVDDESLMQLKSLSICTTSFNGDSQGLIENYFTNQNFARSNLNNSETSESFYLDNVLCTDQDINGNTYTINGYKCTGQTVNCGLLIQQ